MSKTSRRNAFGLNTEESPLFLRPRNHPQFQNARYKGDAIVPRAGNGSYTTPTGTELWLAQQLGVSDVARLGVQSEDAWHAYCAIAADGDVTIRDDTGTEEALSFAAPVAPNFEYFAITALENGMAPGDVRNYAAAYGSALSDGYVAGLGDVVTVTNDVRKQFLGTVTGDNPEQGDTLTNATKGETATAHAVSGSTLLIKQSEKSGTGAAWESSDSITWSGGSAALTANEETAYAIPTFSRPTETAPTDAATWLLYGLADSGIYYDVSGGGWTIDATLRTDNEYFPYDNEESTVLLTPYAGPLDKSNLPETLLVLSDIGNARAVALNKECLFVAIGDEVYISEPTEYRQFRSGYALRARGTILKMVQRPYGLDSIVQVFTTAGVDIIVGSPPYFEIRPTGINEAPSAQSSIVNSDAGTWALYDDGWYVMDGFTRKNVTYRINTDWIEAIADPTAVVAGVDKGIAYLIDATGRGLAYDWEQQQFFETPYTTQPDGFYWSETSRVLVAKIGSTYETVGQGSAAVAWTVQFPTQGGLNEVATPEALQIVGTGTMLVQYYVDDDLILSATVDPAVEDDNMVPLPEDFAREWYVVLSGTGTPSNTEIRSTAYVP